MARRRRIHFAVFALRLGPEAPFAFVARLRRAIRFLVPLGVPVQLWRLQSGGAAAAFPIERVVLLLDGDHAVGWKAYAVARLRHAPASHLRRCSCNVPLAIV